MTHDGCLLPLLLLLLLLLPCVLQAATWSVRATGCSVTWTTCQQPLPQSRGQGQRGVQQGAQLLLETQEQAAGAGWV
jgi:hypothetical protein